MCELCGAGGMIVHHKDSLTPQNINDPNVSLNWDNLELLCQCCHNKAHGLGSTSIETGFDAAGNLIPTTPTPPRSISPKKRLGTGQGSIENPGSPQSNLGENSAAELKKECEAMSKQLTFIDFFSGIGGFRLGFESAGHKCVGSCKKDKFAMKSYRARRKRCCS